MGVMRTHGPQAGQMGMHGFILKSYVHVFLHTVE